MTIPDYQTIMLPLLEYAKNGKSNRFSDVIEYLGDKFELTDEEKRELLPSGKQVVFRNRVGWALTYLKKARLLDSQKRGFFQITQRGVDILGEKPDKIDVNDLKQYPEFIEFQTKSNKKNASSIDYDQEKEDIEQKTPDELIEEGYTLIKNNLGQELLDKLKNNSPQFFENAVLSLLESMGYGQGKVTGQSGDGGIDGIVYQDKLGLGTIIFQAKRFNTDNRVTASMIRDFVGTLDLNGVTRGVFITTSRFPQNAENVISGSHKSIRLIDGKELVKLMIDYDVGVTTHKVYKIKKIDSDFFMESEE